MERMLHKAIWIDDVKLMATLGVIVLHVASPAVFTEFNSFGGNNNWWVANFYDSFCRFCVPLFIMVTGALLLPQQIGLKLFLQKRLKRILLPFIFWTGVYLVFNLGLKIRDFGIGAIDNLWTWFYVQLIQGPSVHLWYVYMIIGLYLFIPIIKPWVQQASNQAILYFLGIWLVIILVNQIQIIRIYSPFDIRYFSSYLGYLVLGYYLAERIVVTKNLKILSIIIFILGFLVTLIGTFLDSQQKNIFSDNFYQYLTLNVVFASIGMFVFIKSWKPNKTLTNYATFRNFINKYGFGIYLGHVLIINILSFLGIDYCLTTPWLSIPLVAIICLIITCLMIYILDKLPFGKYIAR
jgi:surface polysaccharide O-acyltransferase-like enzyme